MPNKEEIARGATRPNKRGSTDNARRLEKFRNAANSKGEADWGATDPHAVLRIVTAVTAIGGAVTFGLSRDGGAYMLTLLLDGDRETLWFNGSSEINEELEGVIMTLESMR